MKRLFFLALLLLPACGTNKKLEETKQMDIVLTFDNNITTTIRCEQVPTSENIKTEAIEKLVM